MVAAGTESIKVMLNAVGCLVDSQRILKSSFEWQKYLIIMVSTDRQLILSFMLVLSCKFIIIAM